MPNPKIEQINIGKNTRFDSFGFISKNLLITANVNWYDGLVRINDLEKNTCKKIGTPTYIKTMEKFNVSAAILCIVGNTIYLAEAIKPEIKIIPIKEEKFIKSLKLSPPFYIPVPSEYTAQKYDTKAHRGWMGSWTAISDIMSNNGFLLVRYKWGYDFLYGYELINLSNPNNRYYISKIPALIYDFSLEAKNILFYMAENSSAGDIEWKKAKASF